VTWSRTRGSSFFALKRVGVRFEGEVREFGVPIRDTAGRCRFVGRGEENIEGVGEDICIARTEEGVRKGGRDSTLLGVRGVESAGGCMYDVVLGIGDIGSFSLLDAASSPTTGEMRSF
jgi:hypothetical protein